MRPSIVQVWTFGSSSSPDKTYETIQYSDGTLSCDCPGWTRRVDARGNRSCKHTRTVDQGLADRAALRSKNYRSPGTPVGAIAAKPQRKLLLTDEDI